MFLFYLLLEHTLQLVFLFLTPGLMQLGQFLVFLVGLPDALVYYLLYLAVFALVLSTTRVCFIGCSSPVLILHTIIPSCESKCRLHLFRPNCRLLLILDLPDLPFLIPPYFINIIVAHFPFDLLPIHPGSLQFLVHHLLVPQVGGFLGLQFQLQLATALYLLVQDLGL